MGLQMDWNEAIVNTGDWTRLKAALTKGLAGEPVTAVFLGGSITQGFLASAPERCYTARTAAWLKAQLPAADVKFVNAGIGATDSQFGVARADADVLAYQPDVVFVEFSVNDEAREHYQETYEGLVRKLLKSGAAVVLIHSVRYDDGTNAEEFHLPVGRHYGLPCVSMRATLWNKIQQGELTAEEITTDMLHPNDRGHELMAEGICHLLGKVLAEAKGEGAGAGAAEATGAGVAAAKAADAVAGAAAAGDAALPAPLVSDEYENSLRIDNRTADADPDGFEPDLTPQTDITDCFRNGWKATRKGAKIGFTVYGSSLAVQFRRTIQGPAPVARAVVDGDENNAVILDGNYDQTWGDWLALTTIAEHIAGGEHRLEIEIIREAGEGAAGETAKSAAADGDAAADAAEGAAQPFELISVIVAGDPANYDRVPCDPDATPEAKALLERLCDGAGRELISGQHTQTNPMEERRRVRELTGVYPKLVGFEMLSYSPNINYQDTSEPCLTEVFENRGTMDTALELAAQGEIIPALCFHWFSPIGGCDKAFYSEHTDFDPRWILEEGSEAEKKFYSDLDVIAEQLARFRDRHIAVIWRPFHEAEGTWFWWGRCGAQVTVELWMKMYRYFTQVKGLHNLLWAWSSPVEGAYPGDEFVDIVGWDIYLPEKQATDYGRQFRHLTKCTSPHKVHALTEIGYMPDPELVRARRVPWAFFMTWSKEFILSEQFNTEEDVRAVYGSDYVVTV